MTIDFNKINENINYQFKGGNLAAHMRVFDDGANKIMKIRLEPGASIGVHTHTDNCEIIYCIAGHGMALCDGTEENIEPGQVHYCPKGSSHTLRNDGNEELIIFAVVG